MLLWGGDCLLFIQSVWTSGRKWHSRKVLNKRKMLVSQWKQEVVACVLHSLEESKKQRENSLNRSGRSKREKCRSRGRVGRTKDQRRQPGQHLGRPWISWGAGYTEKGQWVCVLGTGSCSNNKSKLLWFVYLLLCSTVLHYSKNTLN